MLLATEAGRPDRFEGLFTVDYTAVVLYFVVMLGLGYMAGRIGACPGSLWD